MTLALYLSRMIGYRILVVALAFLALAIIIDLIENSTEIIERYGGGAVGVYVLLRAPQMLLSIFPVSILIGAVLAFATLALKSEITVLRAAGCNTLRLVLRLLPLALLLGLLMSQITGTVGPAAERELGVRFPEMFESPRTVRDIWLRDRTGVVRIGEARERGADLRTVSIFETDENGALLRRIDADRAAAVDGGWRLTGASLQDRSGSRRTIEEMPWQTPLSPIGVLTAAQRPELIGTAEIRQVLAGKLPGGRGTPFYTVKLWRSYSAYIVPLVMILFAALASFGLSRSGGFARFIAWGFAGGLGFIVLDGVVASLGEAGAVGAVPAAFLAPGLFLVAGLWLIVLAEE